MRAMAPLAAGAPLLWCFLAAHLLPRGSAQFQTSPTTADPINCGGFFESNCSACPKDNGEAWCNGDCLWVFDECRDKTWLTWLLHYFIKGSKGGIYTGTSWVVSGSLMFCFALMYKHKVVNQLSHDTIREKGDDYVGRKRTRGLCDCFFKLSTCLYSTFCVPLVAAKNYDVAGVCPFWPACVIMFVGMYSPLYCLTAWIRTVWSGKLKRNLGLERDFCWDFFLSLFCWHCEVGRENMEVNEALDVEITCINQVQSTWVPPPVPEIMKKEPPQGSCAGLRKACQ